MKTLTQYILVILISGLLFGCSTTASPEPTASATVPPISVTQTPAQATPTDIVAPTVTATSAPLTTPIPNENGLTIEENEIAGQLRGEPLTFQPVHGSQQAILERHSEQKEDPYSFSTRYSVTDGEHTYEASEDVDDEDRVIVSVKRDGETLFQMDAGDSAPVGHLYGLWIEDGHWVLEIAFVTTTNEDNVITTEAVGQVYRDGVSLNEQFGYEEMFGYQLLDGKPFYFYQQNGEILLSYDGEVLPLQYDEVPHYQCCSGAAMNPVAASNWVGFWGLRGEVWYYTEIGRY